jgi:hypothetical protein
MSKFPFVGNIFWRSELPQKTFQVFSSELKKLISKSETADMSFNNK